MRLNTVSTQILNFSDSNKRGNFENFLRNYFVVHLSAENSPENGPGRAIRYREMFGLIRKNVSAPLKSSLQFKVAPVYGNCLLGNISWKHYYFENITISFETSLLT